MARNAGKPTETASTPCACGPRTAPARDSGLARAVGVDPAIKDANLVQLRRIEGQVRGIASMIAEERYCADIITQVAAVRESLHTVARNLMRNHLRHCAAAAMRSDGPERDQMIDELLNLAGKLAR